MRTTTQTPQPQQPVAWNQPTQTNPNQPARVNPNPDQFVPAGVRRMHDRMRARMNQPVTIDGIHARSLRREGEFHLEAAPSGNQVQRILWTVATMACAAHTYHINKNCEADPERPGALRIKEDRKNNITRLVSDEFEFYTQHNQPLSTDDFQKIIEYIEEMAKNLQPNLVLILASFPVLGDDGLVHNTIVHVQTGPSPAINIFAKTTKAMCDPVYEGHDTADLYTGQYYDQQDPESAPPTLLSDQHGFTIPRNSVTKVRTVGGAEYYSLVDVCLDHSIGIAKKNLQHEISERVRNSPLDLIPNQVSHVLTSSSFTPILEQTVGRMMMHADPDVEDFSKPAFQVRQDLSDDQMAQINSAFGSFFVADPARPQAAFAGDRSTLVVSHPDFGNDLEFAFLAPYGLDRLPGAFIDNAERELQPA